MNIFRLNLCQTLTDSMNHPANIPFLLSVKFRICGLLYYKSVYIDFFLEPFLKF